MVEMAGGWVCYRISSELRCLSEHSYWQDNHDDIWISNIKEYQILFIEYPFSLLFHINNTVFNSNVHEDQASLSAWLNQ